MIYKIISKKESQVGKYIDLDGDGKADGIIFADLAIGGEGFYKGNENAHYKIPALDADALRDYVVIDTYTDILNGTQEMLQPVVDGQDRFYVMDLKDIQNNCAWYTAAYAQINDYDTITSQDFGAGKTNTTTMIEKWNIKAYGEQNSSDFVNDLWGEIQEQVNKGWFVPSQKELLAFCNIINDDNFEDRGLCKQYWSSSVCDRYSAYCMNTEYNIIKDYDMVGGIRLATTF